MPATHTHHTRIDLVIRTILLIAVLSVLAHASRANTFLVPDRPGPDPNATRGRSGDDRGNSPETRFALVERDQQRFEDRLTLLERQHIEHSRECSSEWSRIDRRLIGIEAVSAANTQANWIVGGGFLAQFAFSLLRYLNSRNGKSKFAPPT